MSSQIVVAEPKGSATVILVRQEDQAPWEVFLARRHQRQSFMAGAYVFPGGQVDASDGNLSDHIHLPENFDPVALLQDETLSFAEAIRLYVCAIRKTFEETGVLIAKKSDGKMIRPECDADAAKLASFRSDLCLGKKTLQDIARQENLFFPLDALVPFALWITPEIVSKRFSTLFFLARLPEGQSATTDAVEMTDYLWTTPRDALRMYGGKEIILMPPTLKTLEEISAFATLDALWNSARVKDIYPILPQPGPDMLKLPHDPEYSIERYKQPARPGEPSRILLAKSIWRTGFCPEN